MSGSGQMDIGAGQMDIAHEWVWLTPAAGAIIHSGTVNVLHCYVLVLARVPGVITGYIHIHNLARPFPHKSPTQSYYS